MVREGLSVFQTCPSLGGLSETERLVLLSAPDALPGSIGLGQSGGVQRLRSWPKTWPLLPLQHEPRAPGAPLPQAGLGTGPAGSQAEAGLLITVRLY